MKDHLESLKCLRKTKAGQRNVQRGRPHYRSRGGGNGKRRTEIPALLPPAKRRKRKPVAFPEKGAAAELSETVNNIDVEVFAWKSVPVVHELP